MASQEGFSDQAALADLLALLGIDGPPAREKQVADFIRRRVLELGVGEGQVLEDSANARSEYGGDCGNLIVHLPGQAAGPRLMFSAHMDAVPSAVGCEPHYEKAGNRIINQAAGKALGGDDRSGCAILLHIIREWSRLGGKNPDAVCVFLVQEEVGLIGARELDLDLLGRPLPGCCFNFDSQNADEMTTKIIGAERFSIRIEGQAAHAGVRPECGISAGMIAACALADLSRAGWHGIIRKDDGEGTANVGAMHGGELSNTVMPEMNILAEARSHCGTFRKSIIDAWKEHFEQACLAHPDKDGRTGKVSLKSGANYESFDRAADAPVVAMARAAGRKAGLEMKSVCNNGGMDANQLMMHGIPTVTLGVGHTQVHTPSEVIRLDEFFKACRVASALICGEKR